MSKDEINRKIDALRVPVQQGLDWTGDEAANAELLDEMLAAGLRISMESNGSRKNEVLLLCPYFAGDGGTMFRYERKTAVAKAWLYWKESQ